MKKLLAATCLAALIAISGAGRAEDITRFAPLKADQEGASRTSERFE